MRKLIAGLFAGSLLLVFQKGNSQTPRPLPDNYTGPLNYVRTWDAVKPETNAGNLTTAAQPRVARMATQYVDGLGRSIQSVVKQGSLVTDPTNPSSAANASDVVNAVEYDAFGREQFKYLPFASTTGTGTYKTDAFQQQQSFVQGQFGSQGESFFYSHTLFEPSPLNRVSETYAPGNSWAGSEGTPTPHAVKASYWINTDPDGVRIWNVQDVSGSFGTYTTPMTSGTYPVGELYKTVTEDERGKQVIEFKDKEGKVILKKEQLLDTYNGSAVKDDGTGRGYEGWLCTYYLYDDLGQLRCVVQPKGVDLLRGAGWDMTALGGDILAEQCFRYEYDARGRMILKKVPGAEPVYMVYDKRDRLVMTQDGNLRKPGQEKWLVTFYDELNRPMGTGLWANASVRATHETAAQNSTDYFYPFTQATTPSAGWEELTGTFYDDYTWLAAYGSPVGATYTTAYDGYLQPASSTVWPYPKANSPSSQLKGLVTGTRVKVLGTNTYLYTSNFYDDKGRLLQVQSRNNGGGLDVATTQYSWAGQPLIAVQKHEASSGAVQSTVLTQMSYDELGRPIKTEKKIANTAVNGGAMPAAFTTVAENAYDALGQLKTKSLGRQKDINGSYTGTPVETLGYEYNIRGWTLGANREFTMTPGDASHYFGFDLAYDKKDIFRPSGSAVLPGYSQGAYNGNMTGTLWKSRGDDVIRKYDFTYDNVNRLTGAAFTQASNGSWNNTDMDYSVDNLGYDQNGNIYSMRQRGWKLGAAVHNVVDDLLYTYKKFGVSNQLQNVIDQANDPTTTLGDFKSTQKYLNNWGGVNKDPNNPYAYTDYTYDDNGNLKKDLNKDIGTTGADGIAYNHLNLPQTINVDGKGTITYVYDAAGNKLRKVTTETGAAVTYNGNNYSNVTITTTTDYTAGFIYESKGYSDVTLNAALGYTAKLQFTGQEEGRIRAQYNDAGNANALTGFTYDYMIKDHLGNVRMVLTEETTVDKYPVASLEPSKVATEQTYYNIQSGNIVPVGNATGLPVYTNGDNGIGNNPADATFEGANSQYLYQLNANTAKTGLGITLKVMAGDRLDIYGRSYYTQSNTGGYAANSGVPFLEILNAFLGSGTGAVAGAGHAGVSGTALNALSSTTSGIQTLFNNQTTDNNQHDIVPKAYVNYLFFDEQFKCVGSGFSSVGGTGEFKQHNQDAAMQNIPVPKNGYVYIYCSNESPVPVFFDNLQVVHTKGAILEETHYYPFGLAMAGISSRAAGGVVNRKKWNKGSELQSEEFSDGSGLEMYATPLRSLDPQLGRWWQIDPKPDYSQSLYSAMGNNPILFNDPLGDTATAKWRSGFLGIFGKRHEARYVGGQWIDARTRGAVDANSARGGARRVMNDYSKLNTISDYSPVTTAINNAPNSINLNGKGGPDTGGSETGARKYFTDLRNGVVNPDIDVYSAKTDNVQVVTQNGNQSNAPSYVRLGHELGHVWDILTSTPSAANFTQVPGVSPGISNSEANAMYWENVLRGNAGMPLRTFYNMTSAGVLEYPANINTRTVTTPVGSVLLTTISNLGGALSTTFRQPIIDY